MIDKVRQIALKILYNVDKNGAFSNIELDKTLNNIRNEEKNNKFVPVPNLPKMEG